MRIAAALPSLQPGTPQGRSIDAMLARLHECGHQIEGFAEHDRSDEAAAFPIYHYLRMAERHRAVPFDTALYPLGRDATPYQSVFALMNAFPGVVWFLDPIMHHLAVGGIALMEDWAAYRGLLDESYGPTGAAVAQTVAVNWGTGALYRHYDLVAAAADSQLAVLAAWPALARRIASRLEGGEVSVVPLGVEASVAQTRGGSQAGGPMTTEGPSSVRRIAIMTVNESYATTAVRAAAAVLETLPEVSVRLCLSEPIYKAEGVKVARHKGIDDRIEWELTTSPQRLSEVAAGCDVLVWLAEELQGGHRLLLMDGLAAGKITFVPRCPLYDDLPEGAVVKLDLGHTLGPMFAALLRGIIDDAELHAGLSSAARAFAEQRATVAQAADTLISELQKVAAAGGLSAGPVSAATWRAVDAMALDAALPSGASASTERLIVDIVRAHTEPFGT